MRLTELSLEKYGGCASRELTIPETAGLTVVYGANEAGKSTCLEAISDFLFSIPKNTQRGSLFGYDGMRIRASMLMADGSTVTLKRRKGNGKTLADLCGTALDDTVLAPVLGAITRERFETLFGLNHETLRNGGERLLHADGDIGRLIVEAGGGLRTLVSRLESIDGEADKLFDTRRSVNRVFYQQLTTFEAAEKTARGAQLTRETFEQTRKASLAAAEKLEALRIERRSLGASTSRLERVLRVVPHLRQLAGLTQDLVCYDDVASFPDDFAAKMRTALDQRNKAEMRLEGAIERRDRLKARLDALVVNPGLKAAEQRVRDLAERAIHVSKARSDRANRQREIDDGEAQLAALRRMLGLPDDADLAPLIPDQSALNLVRSAADEIVERRPGLASARKRLGELVASLTVIDDRLETARQAGHNAPPEASSSAFASLAAQKSAHQARQQALDTDNATLTGRLKALGFDTIDVLATLSCPSVDDIRSEQAARETLTSQIEYQAKLKRQAEREISTGEAEIGSLQASGTIASDASLAEARILRADAWRPIKSAYVAGHLPDDATARLAVADDLESAIVSADQLADRRAAEAERAASLALALRRVADARTDVTVAEAEMAALVAQLEVRTGQWGNSFPQVQAKHPELASLLKFAQARQLVLDESERLRTPSNALEIDVAQLAPTVELLERIEQSRKLDSTLSFSARVSAVQTAISLHEQAHAGYVRDMRDREDFERQRKLVEAEVQQLSDAQAAWDAAWPTATSGLGLKPDISPTDANSAVTEWVGARGVLSAIGQTRQRLKRMDEDETNLTKDVSSLATELAIEIGEDCVVAAQMLLARFTDNATAQTQYDGILPDFEEAKVEADQAQEALGTAREVLAKLAASVKLDGSDDGILLDTASRCEARMALGDEIALVERTATDVGDKLDLTALRAEWDERDLDEVRAELTEQTSRATEIEGEIEAAILTEKAAKDDLAVYLSQSEVNHAVAEREAAAAQMHLALERYLELSVARELVTSAMATIRAEQQDPLIARAGELFKAATLGEFAGIETDIDDKGHPVVVGRRANGGIAAVVAMSDGTRDQLFLAFRLASLENYASATEPLPFIADDVLVHFDDERSRSTLDLLAEFGKTNQVLLFTHHRSVRALAEPLVQQGLANIIDLDRAA
ncbi:YhaN family protein [Novosphingobium resinovorum]|uniref:Chromosome segregation protein SMC n=1 Tax=Novosphingobium resinovorum TaxID=158500 RepID=A0A1D8AE33_9SPHN|nr:YhaN family protein [Novosphingobium resinovorum]AOR80321.1 chromosome segregation protein SMC [Novosphingobium resinovorum]